MKRESNYNRHEDYDAEMNYYNQENEEERERQ